MNRTINYKGMKINIKKEIYDEYNTYVKSLTDENILNYLFYVYKLDINSKNISKELEIILLKEIDLQKRVTNAVSGCGYI